MRVGRVTVLWSHLEFAVNQAIWELSNVGSGPGACITAQIISIGPRMRSLISLLIYRGCHDEIMSIFQKFSRKAEALGRQRNRFVHDPVYLTVASGKLNRLEVKTDAALNYQYEPVDFEYLDDLFEKIKLAIDEFDHLFGWAALSLRPWPKTQYEQSLRDHPTRQRSQPIGPPGNPARPRSWLV